MAVRLMLTHMRENRSKKGRQHTFALNQLCPRLCHAVRAQMRQISTLGDWTRVLPCGLILVDPEKVVFIQPGIAGGELGGLVG